ncbi:hypothetical protein GOBAR_DD15538 [Gossypium barbadense]|nr:hypothetical protein GOBAR_DD15538 [Gossypium barbadense]
MGAGHRTATGGPPRWPEYGGARHAGMVLAEAWGVGRGSRHGGVRRKWASGGEIKFCPTELKIAGQCGIKGGWDCFLAINAKVGASGMAMNCSCQPLPNNERNCKCMVVCRD